MNKVKTQNFKSHKSTETFFDPSETVTLLNDDENKRQVDQLSLIYNEESFTLSSYLTASLIMCIMAWPHANQHLLSAWFVCTGLILSVRFFLKVSFQSLQDKNIRPHKWYLRFIIMNIMSGAVIGSIGFISLPAEQTIFPMIITVGLIIVTSVSVSTLSMQKYVFAGFMIPCLLPATLNTLFSNDSFNKSLAILIIIYSIALLLLSKRNRLHLEKYTATNHQNILLLDDLTASKTNLESKNRELQQLASEDSLTGLSNRRYGDSHIEKEWSKAIRHNRSISMIMIDIDHFKLYNDHYGHQKGDACLQIVAQGLKNTLSRPADLAIRYGGEEFMLVLPDTDISGANKIAGRLQDMLQAISIPHEYSSVSDHVTVSCGIASMTPRRNDKSSTLIHQSDIAMYKAKFKGGNRTVLFR